jgi:hypothetical protein
MGTEPAKPNKISSKTKLNYVVDFVTLLLILAMIGTGVVIRYVLPPGSGGHGGGERWLLWGLDRHEWGGLHFWLAVGLAAVMLLHVALHWKWICGVTRRWIGRLRNGGVRLAHRTAYGLAFLALVTLLLAGFVSMSFSSVEVIEQQNRGYGRRHLEASEPRAFPASSQAEPDRAIAESLDEHHSPEHHSPEHRAPARAHLNRKHSHADHDASVRGSMTLREVARQSGTSVAWLKERLGLPSSVPDGARLGRLKRRYGFEIDDVRRAVATHGKHDGP